MLQIAIPNMSVGTSYLIWRKRNLNYLDSLQNWSYRIHPCTISSFQFFPSTDQSETLSIREAGWQRDPNYDRAYLVNLDGKFQENGFLKNQ